MTNNDSSTGKCIPDNESLMAAKIIEIFASVISFLACLFVIAVVTVYKKYVVITQRLLLYFTLIVLLNTFAHILEGFDRIINMDESYCVAVAFLKLYSALCIVLCVMAFLIEITMRLTCFKEMKCMECLYIPFIFLLPTTISWIPLVIGPSFGREGYLCDFTVLDNNSCQMDQIGFILDITLWWIPLFITLLTGGFGLIYIFWRLKHSSKQYTAIIEVNRIAVYQRLVSEIAYLKWYPFVYIIQNALLVAIRILYFIRPHGQHDKVFLGILYILFISLQGCVLALLFTLDPKTRKRLKWKDFKAAFIQNILCREPVEEYPILTGDHITDSFRGTTINASINGIYSLDN